MNWPKKEKTGSIFSTSKTVTIQLQTKKLKTDITLYLNKEKRKQVNTKIPRSQVVQKKNIKRHIQNLKEKCGKRLNMIKS